ncbi:acetyl-CoA carboxylase carboxyltransferase subunit alpha [Couchioplanes azureus]|uniref:acetyl-CoA carboxylase carboxyltransferase subunit alpha n=1 Tax=Couchioplanes caeruleus TaxID=56438 RepID=UPI00357147F5
MRPTEDAEATCWLVCPGCRNMIYSKRLHRNLKVCPDCGSHHRLTALERLDQLLDPDSVERIDVAVRMRDPLSFVDSKPYPERWAAAQKSTGLSEAAVIAAGRVHGQPVIAAVMDFRFLGGSLGAGVGEVIATAADVALRRRVPLLMVTASGGARMQEGAVALMQMAKTSQALGQLDEAGILTVSLVTDPTYGGVAASFATLADVIIAEPGARLGFAGPRVIAQTIRQTLPPGFQTAEFLLERGLIDAIHPRHALRQVLSRILGTGGRRGRDTGAAVEDVVVTDVAALPEVPAWDAVQRARNVNRPTTLDYLSRVFDDYVELRGDRISGDCAAIVGGLARLAGVPLVVVGHQKGSGPAELVKRNYGMASPAGYRKAARLCRLAAKLGLPVITFVDTPGAYPGIAAEEQGQAVAIAESIRLMSGLPVPVITVITGEGGSGGALALAVADQVLMCANAVYSVISPEGCAAILWSDATAAPRAAEALRVDARRLLQAGLIDGVIPEPLGGAHSDHQAAAGLVHDALVTALRRLSASNPARLVESRRRKFRQFGSEVVTTVEAMR